VSEWAGAHDINPRNALNMARKQTIPAFMVAGKWMIGAE
jgi:hypothetical protein